MTDEVLKKILDIDGEVEIPFIVMKSLRKVRGFKVGDTIVFDGNLPLNMKFKFNSLPPGGQKVCRNKEEVLNNEWVFVGSGSDIHGVTYYKFSCCQRINNKPMTFKVFNFRTSRMELTITSIPKTIRFLGFSEDLDFEDLLGLPEDFNDRDVIFSPSFQGRVFIKAMDDCYISSEQYKRVCASNNEKGKIGIGCTFMISQDFGTEYTVVAEFEKKGKKFYVCRATTLDGEEKSPKIFCYDEQGILILKDFN